MTTRTVHPDRGLPELGPDLEREWWDWLARHGLPDPYRICGGGPIVCDDDERTVSAWCKVKNEQGRDILGHSDACCLGHPHPYEVCKQWITVQLEAPALPLPLGYPVVVESKARTKQ